MLTINAKFNLPMIRILPINTIHYKLRFFIYWKLINFYVIIFFPIPIQHYFNLFVSKLLWLSTQLIIHLLLKLSIFSFQTFPHTIFNMSLIRQPRNLGCFLTASIIDEVTYLFSKIN